MKHSKCGWCKRALTKKRREESPLGPECESSLPDELRIALLNMTEHDSYHSSQDTAPKIAQRAIDDVFGDEIDLIVIIDMMYTANMNEAVIASYRNDEGKAELVHLINPDLSDTELDEGGYNFFSKQQLLLRRQTAMMIDNRTRTKVNVAHIDADWVWFLNGGGYGGPVSSKTTVGDHATANGWDLPVPACPHCHLLQGERDYIYSIEESVESLMSKYSDYENCGLARTLHKKLVTEMEYSIEQSKESLELVEEDFTHHSWFRELPFGFLGNLENWGAPNSAYDGFVTNNEILDYFESEGGHEIEPDSELSKRILTQHVIPYFLRGITVGFNEKWEWITGKAMYFNEEEEHFWSELPSSDYY